MEVELDNTATKEYLRLNEPDLSRITAAIDKLEEEPPEGDIKKLRGKDGYRVRVGSYRIIFDIELEKVVVYRIARRGRHTRRPSYEWSYSDKTGTKVFHRRYS